MRTQKRWADVLSGEKVCFGDQTQAIWTKEGMFAHFAGSSKYVDGSRRVYEPDAGAERPRRVEGADAVDVRPAAKPVKRKKQGLLENLGSMFNP